MSAPSASIVHAIPGRLRLQLTGREKNLDSAETIDRKLAELDGVDCVRVVRGNGR